MEGLPTVSPERAHDEEDLRNKDTGRENYQVSGASAGVEVGPNRRVTASYNEGQSFFYTSRARRASDWQPRVRNRGVSSRLPFRAPPASSPGEILSPPRARRLVSLSSPLRFTRPKFQFLTQAKSIHRPQSVPRELFKTRLNIQYQVIGDPCLKILRVRLAPYLLGLVDEIVLGCEDHAATLASGWLTELYSLTKQDIALSEAPHLYQLAKPITTYIKHVILTLYGAQSVTMDRNQPHVLKYAVKEGHTGVQLHHDKCDVTANMCMSRSSSYAGGGTFFPALGHTVRLEFGEFLLHPGGLVHGGEDIVSGTRHLMVIFANINHVAWKK